MTWDEMLAEAAQAGAVEVLVVLAALLFALFLLTFPWR